MAPPVEAKTTRAPDRARRLEHVERAEDVDVGVEAGFSTGLAHVGLRGAGGRRLGPDARDRAAERVGLADVELVQLGLVGAPDGLAGGEIVDDVARRGRRPAKRVGQVGADEPGSAGDECGGHTATFRPMSVATEAVVSIAEEIARNKEPRVRR